MSAREIVTTMAREAGPLVNEVHGPRRYRSLIRCRRAIALRLRSEGCSWPQVGRAIGKHWTTAMALLDALPSKPARKNPLPGFPVAVVGLPHE